MRGAVTFWWSATFFAGLILLVSGGDALPAFSFGMFLAAALLTTGEALDRREAR